MNRKCEIGFTKISIFNSHIDEVNGFLDHSQPTWSDRSMEEFHSCMALLDCCWKQNEMSKFVLIGTVHERRNHLHFMVRQHHRIDLDGVDQIGVVTDQSCQFGLSNLLQLFGSEWRWLIRQFVPESISATHVAKLGSDNACEGRPQHRSGQWTLGHTTRPEIYIRRMPAK